MNPGWHDFLSRHGANLIDGAVKHFGKPADELDATARGTVLCDLGQYGLLRVSGDDAQSFLQNLLSNDISEATANHAQYSSLNTAKGRMLASMMIWRDEADYLIKLPRTLCEPIRKKLSLYVLRAKVTIAGAGDEHITLGLSGDHAKRILSGQFSDVPQTSLGIINSAQGSVIRIGDSRFQINTTAQHAPSLWQTLLDHAQPVGSPCWDWLDIRAGIPVIQPQTQEQFVAQMVNFDLIGGVSFKKGCYPGQEIVARTRYLGKLKRRMYLAHLDTGKAPGAGDELFSADTEGQASGMIVNAAAAPGGGYDVLAVVQASCRETQAVHHQSLTGPALEFLHLPYALPPT